MALSIREKYADMLKTIANLSVAAGKIDETNVGCTCSGQYGRRKPS